MSRQRTDDSVESLEADLSAKQIARKIGIILCLIGSLVPPLWVNIGLNAEKAGVTKLASAFKARFPSFDALLLCQRWSLFTYISPFNYTMHFEVEMSDGRTVQLRDLTKETAGRWESVRFHNEAKLQNNLYGNRAALRRYLEYLIRTNGVDAMEVTRRTSFIRYRDLLSRKQAAAAGSYYGPEIRYVLESY